MATSTSIMSIGEMLLRLGSCLVAWLIVYTHLIWLATLARVGCGTDGDQLWMLLLFFAPVAIGATWLLRVTRPLEELHAILRWFGVPLMVLLPMAAFAIWPSFVSATLGGRGVCNNAVASVWQAGWAPVQTITLAFVAVTIWRVWRDSMAPRSRLGEGRSGPTPGD
jgi:hypothetical protein